MEFAEAAAKMIREKVSGQKKIVLSPNRKKFRGCAKNSAEIAVADGSPFVMFPFSTHSNNFITGMVARRADVSQANELLRTESVIMEVTCTKATKEQVEQYMISCGGYDIRNHN